jgi:hypothetical protein
VAKAMWTYGYFHLTHNQDIRQLSCKTNDHL